MQKQYKIRRRRDFLLVSKCGVFSYSDFFIVQAYNNSLSNWRSGFTASKKIGCAVVRNKAKRFMREAAVILLKEFGIDSIDYVFIAKKNIDTINWHIIFEQMKIAILHINKKIENEKNI